MGFEVVWTRHVRERFFERAIKYGITEAEVELNVLRQTVKVKQKEKSTVKTIFKIAENFFTVVKEEKSKYINVVSIWESNEEEIMLWKKYGK